MSAEPERPIVVLTGAAGEVGTAIRPVLRRMVRELRLVDCRPISDPQPGETCWMADLRQAGALDGALHGASAIIHLAGIAVDAPWDVLQRDSVDLVVQVLRAAEQAGIHRIALASTMHVLGGYRRTERIGASSPPRPDSRYAESKVRVEVLGRAHGARTGARVTAVRIGCLKPLAADSEPLGWVGPSDLARLFLHVLFHPLGRTRVVNAVAPHKGDDCGQRRLWWRHGFRFREHGESRSVGLARAAQWYPHDFIAREYRGGEFASAGQAYGMRFPSPSAVRHDAPRPHQAA